MFEQSLGLFGSKLGTRESCGSGTGLRVQGGGEGEFEEARDRKGRGSVAQHRADGEQVCPRRSKQTQLKAGAGRLG